MKDAGERPVDRLRADPGAAGTGARLLLRFPRTRVSAGRSLLVTQAVLEGRSVCSGRSTARQPSRPPIPMPCRLRATMYVPSARTRSERSMGGLCRGEPDGDPAGRMVAERSHADLRPDTRAQRAGGQRRGARRRRSPGSPTVAGPCTPPSTPRSTGATTATFHPGRPAGCRSTRSPKPRRTTADFVASRASPTTDHLPSSCRPRATATSTALTTCPVGRSTCLLLLDPGAGVSGLVPTLEFSPVPADPPDARVDGTTVPPQRQPGSIGYVIAAYNNGDFRQRRSSTGRPPGLRIRMGIRRLLSPDPDLWTGGLRSHPLRRPCLLCDPHPLGVVAVVRDALLSRVPTSRLGPGQQPDPHRPGLRLHSHHRAVALWRRSALLRRLRLQFHSRRRNRLGRHVHPRRDPRGKHRKGESLNAHDPRSTTLTRLATSSRSSRWCSAIATLSLALTAVRQLARRPHHQGERHRRSHRPLPRRRRDPQDQARHHHRAGEPLLRQLLRDVSRARTASR